MNNKVEILKAEYAIIRDKLLLFAAGAGGSFTMMVNNNFSFALNLLVGSGFLVSLIGVSINLHKAGKILKKLEGFENAG